MIPVIVGFLYIKAEKLSFCIISILLCIYIFQTIKNNYSVYKTKIINLYFPLFVHILLSTIFLYILSNFLDITEERKNIIQNAGLLENMPTILIFGGSQGAQKINEAVIGILENKLNSLMILLIFSTCFNTLVLLLALNKL